MKKSVPKILEHHILPFDWDVRKVWLLEAEQIQIDRVEFDCFLTLPLWSSVPNKGMLFNISPLEVINDKSLSPYQFSRLMSADIDFPIDVLDFEFKFWILDGVHKLPKCMY